MAFQCFFSDSEDIKYVYRTTHRGAWRRKGIKLMYARGFQLFLGLLLLCDVLFLFSQIFIDDFYPPCFVVDQSAECIIVSETQAMDENTSGVIAANVASGNVHAELVCLTDEKELLLIIEDYMFYGTLGILGIFEIQMLVLLLILGWYGFFRDFGNIFDLFIISGSLALELILHDNHSTSASGVLITARVWRLIRIGHGILYSSQTRRKAMGELLSIADSDMSKDNLAGRLKEDFGMEPEDDLVDGEEWVAEQNKKSMRNVLGKSYSIFGSRDKSASVLAATGKKSPLPPGKTVELPAKNVDVSSKGLKPKVQEDETDDDVHFEALNDEQKAEIKRVDKLI